MPYFSFSLKKNFLKDNKLLIEDIDNIVNNKIYFSKNTYLWKNLNKNKNSKYINFFKYEERKKINKIGRKILFCLPPNIGLGDAVEYALSIKAVAVANKFDLIAVAYVGRFEYIFSKYFDLNNIFKDLVDVNEFRFFDTIFHITIEIKDLSHQKYLRADIEASLNSFFKVKRYRSNDNKKKNKIKKITIFPISQSPLRSMPIKILNKIIDELILYYKIEIVLDNRSLISHFIEKEIINRNIERSIPIDIKSLCNKVENIEYGVFMDSGPLHLAKILNKKGIIIISTVSNKILLNDFNSINFFENNYKSKYCTAPCGLTNIFNFKNMSGCYDSLKITFGDLTKLNNTNSLQRGQIKDSYVNFIKNPVSCLSNIDVDKLIKEIKNELEIK